MDNAQWSVAQDRRPLLSVILNAGGQSRRMGRNKALLPVGGVPLIQHVALRLLPLVDERLFVIGNDAAVQAAVQIPCPTVGLADAWPDAGAAGGIATGLAHVEGWAAVVACDLPLVRAEIFRHLLALAQEPGPDGQPWDLVVPVVDGREQTLHALYHHRCLPALHAQLAQGRLRVNYFYDQVRVRRVTEDELRSVDPNLHSFVNANTPDEWAYALALLARELDDAAGR